jgi:glycosyltransferase involved in cell wall biosynthesis
MLPRVGFVGIWNRPHDPAPWSGVPVRLMEALDDLGVFGGYVDATPWPPALRAVHAVLRATNRLDGAWFFGPAPQALLAASNVVRRALVSTRSDAWVVPAMGFGRPVGGRVASLSEISPAQLERADVGVVRSFWPNITPRQLRALGRQQLRLHRAAKVCCVASRWAGSSLVRDHGIDPAKVHVVGYGANVRVEPPAGRDWATPRFLFVGSGWSRKNGDRVVRAFARLRETWPLATLDVVGDHPRLDVQGVTGHGGRRLILDPQGRALLESLYRRATCFVMPSLHESFGIVYVEAGCAGLPTIGTTVGGTADSVGDGGLVVDPFDEAALLAAMLQLSQPAEAMHLGAIAKRRSGLFTWRKVAERIVRALDLPGVDNSTLAPPL